MGMDGLKEYKKKIEAEISKKSKADTEMLKMKRDMLTEAFNALRDDRVLAGGVFELSKNVLGKHVFKGWINDFAGLKEILEAYGMAHVDRITLRTENFGDRQVASRMMRMFHLRGGEIELHFGDNATLPYLKEVVREYGIQVDVSEIQKILENEDRYTGLTKLKEKLIMSGMALGIPMCGLVGFHEEYLAIEEKYARMLHASFKASAFDHGVKNHRELQQDFDLIQTEDLRLFMDMGRAMFKEFSK